jgi:hypothetical protein
MASVFNSYSPKGHVFADSLVFTFLFSLLEEIDNNGTATIDLLS